PESEEQRRAYLALAARLDDAVLVDASGSAPLVAAEAAQAILGCLENRVERRHVPAVPLNPPGARVLLVFCARRVPLVSPLVRLLFNCDIRCRVRSPLRLPHPYGIVIDAQTRIGSRVTVMQQACIGAKEPDEHGAPVLEDDVFVGAGARLLGAIRIGR